jgi:FKBP-type peptidyl-prolyl cis-trans isomerase
VLTKTGLVYLETTAGEGDEPTAADKVKVHYEGRLIDGTVFDSSYQRGQPLEFPLNGVIKGWTEGLQMMKPGGKAKLTIPSDLAYGDAGTGPIPAKAVLVFDVELLAVNP